MFGRGFMGRYKYFAVILILLFLFSTLVAVSHHHECTDDDHNCPICIAINHQSAAGPVTVCFDGIPFLVETTYVAITPVFDDSLVSFSRSIRGPPA